MAEHEASPRIPSKRLHWRVSVSCQLWRGLVFVWSTLIVGIAIATIANLNTTTTDTPLTKLYIVHLALIYPLPVWSSLGFLVMLTLLSGLGKRNKQVTPASSLSVDDRSHILGRLRLRYKQVLDQSLQGMVQLELGLAQKPAAVQNPVSLALRLPNQPEHSLPLFTSIVRAYDLAEQELLILGEPGAGKSTLLLELAYALATEAEQSVKQPVDQSSQQTCEPRLPILLPLASWAQDKPPFDEWLSEEIARLYEVSPRLSQQWIATGQVLLLLDGLDEMEETARPACIAAINSYHREYVHPLVICSRTSEYEAAAENEQLALHTAVVVQPLELKKVNEYLGSLGKPLAGLRAALKTNTLLQELATTPLMLQVLILTYHGTSVRAIPQREASLQEQIWTDYIQRMIEFKGDKKCYPLSVTISWLGFLAREMRRHNETIFSLGILRPDWIPVRRRRRYVFSVWLFVGLLFGLGVGLIGGLRVGLFAGLVFWLLFVLCFELINRLGLSSAAPGSIRETEGEDGCFYGLRPGLFIGLLFGMLAGLATGPVAGLVAGLVTGLHTGPVTGLRTGLGVGLIVCLVAGLSVELLIGLGCEVARPFVEVGFNLPESFSNKEGLVTGLIGLLFGLGVGLVGGLGVGLVGGLSTGLFYGLRIGLGAGLFYGLLFGLDALVRFYLAHFCFIHSFSSRSFLTFLEDATARILLRRIGRGYSFTHRLLLDYFAELDEISYVRGTREMVLVQKEFISGKQKPYPSADER